MKLVPWRRYLVRYRLKGQQKDRALVALYHGKTKVGDNLFVLESGDRYGLPDEAIILAQFTDLPDMQPVNHAPSPGRNLIKTK